MNLFQSTKYKLITEVFEEIESNMKYVGCSAIEDKLQDKVSETINLLKQADIRVFMLTGDKIVFIFK